MNDYFQNLEFEKLIDVYLGTIMLEWMSIDESKSLAYKEIQERAINYRKYNNVDELVEYLNQLECKLQNLYSNYKSYRSISFVDRYHLENETRKFIYNAKKKFHPYINLLTEFNTTINKLEDIGSKDPDNIRYSAKFPGSNFIQSYFNINLKDYFFTKTNIWSYKLSATLGFDYLLEIIKGCVKTDICLLPIESSEWNTLEMELIFNFLIMYNTKKSKKSILWIVFYEDDECLTYSNFIIEDIQKFTHMVSTKSGFIFDLITYTVITKNENNEWDFDALLGELDGYDFLSNVRVKYIGL